MVRMMEQTMSMIEAERLSPEKMSPVEVERLRSMLPADWSKARSLSQLEVILEAIAYIRTLQGKLQ